MNLPPEFDRIYFTEDGKASEGRMRFAQQGVGWKSSATNKTITIPSDQIQRFQLVRAARKYQLRITVASQPTPFKFDNFDRDVHDRLRDTIRSLYHLTLDALELSVRGWNWGSTEVEHDHLVFKVANKLLFELPFAEISNVNAGKNEVAVEFAAADLREGAAVDQLVECRFHVPGTAPAENDDGVDVEGDGNANGDNEDGEGGSTRQSAAEYLSEVIKSKAELDVEKSDTIVAFKELPFLTPRGRYDVDMFKDFFRLRGKSYDYKIKYSNIKQLFLLPKPDEIHTYFVIGLDPPIRQGQTRYAYLVLHFVVEDEMSVELNLTDEQIQNEFNGRLTKVHDALTYKVVSDVFSQLSTVSVIGGLRGSARSAPAFKCSYKANDSLLYVHDDFLVLLPKPANVIAIRDITSVTFARVGASLRTIDMLISVRAGGSGGDVQLTNIPREDHAAIADLLAHKAVKVKNELAEEAAPAAYMDLDDDDDDDDEGDSGRRVRSDGDDDDDESPDEDFVAESESDVNEEFNSDYSSDSGDDGGDPAAAAARKANRGAKKRSKERRGGDDGAPASKKRRTDK
ncbi:structure-specific recognition protein-domain-containing protein [Blastocladiella britannica]|nr:structure-specific recognition protein-domain-containing protein [Blastocladiella britannica]